METPANINNRQAKEALQMIEQTTRNTKKALDFYDTSPWLLLWGGLWIAAYTTCQFYLQYATPILTTMSILGGIGSWGIVWWQNKHGLMKTDSKNPLGRKVFWIWFSLFVYLSIWLALLSPFNGLQFNATLVTAIMFAYIVMGLLYETPSLTIIGIFVTVITLLAYYIFPAYYSLTLAIFGGGTLFGTGVYMRIKGG